MSSSGAESSSPSEVDFLELCTDVRSIQTLVNGEIPLNHRQCRDLSSKLSQTTQNVGELVLHSEHLLSTSSSLWEACTGMWRRPKCW